jgi:hypothetical protein
MRSIFTRKNIVLISSLLVLVLLVLLASGLHGFKLDLGTPFVWDNGKDIPAAVGDTGGNSGPSLWERSISFFAILLWILLFLFFFSPGLRKRLLKVMLNIGLTVLILSFLYENQIIALPGLGETLEGASGQLDTGAGEVISPSAFVPPSESSALSYVITLGMVFVFALSAWYLMRMWMRLRADRATSDTLPDLAAIARSSLRDLSDGHDWQGVIQECYVRMSEAVSKNRGITRQDTMTTGEFARRLEEAGLPAAPVQRLTRLFEMVRYGAKKSSTTDINEAVSSLNAVLHACGEAE